MSSRKVGLENLGNTCFMNSALQSLFATKQFRKAILSYRHPDKVKMPYLIQVRKLFALMQHSKRSFINPTHKFGDVTRPPHFEKGLQEDSSEYLIHLLQRLVEEQYNEINNIDNDIIVRPVFFGKKETNIKCLDCERYSRRTDDFQELFLTLPNDGLNHTIQNLIEYEFRPEELFGASSYSCSVCERQTVAEKYDKIIEGPPHLIVVLKLFEHVSGNNVKLERNFTLKPMDLRISLTDTDDNDQYELYAVVVHEGYTSTAGHYYAFVKNDESDEGWLKCDDSKVTPSTFEELRNLKFPKTPYVLFYRNKSQSDPADIIEIENLSPDLQETIRKDQSAYEQEKRSEPPKTSDVQRSRSDDKPSTSEFDGIGLSTDNCRCPKRTSDGTTVSGSPAKKAKPDVRKTTDKKKVPSSSVNTGSSADESQNILFCRTNVSITVRNKNDYQNMITDIVKIVCKFNEKSGLIYCLSSKDCERVAADLSSCNITATIYHDDMNYVERTVNEMEWKRDHIRVMITISSTPILLIDKKDVRYVIHTCIPNSWKTFCEQSLEIISLDNKSDEPGLARLYYSFTDVARWKCLLIKEENQKRRSGDLESILSVLRQPFDDVHRMMSYSQNVVYCRRHSFSNNDKEKRSICIEKNWNRCDICQGTFKGKVVNKTKDALLLCDIISTLKRRGERVTIHRIVKIYKGSKSKKDVGKRHHKYEHEAKGKHIPRPMIEAILMKLISKKVLKEKCSFDGTFPKFYVDVGSEFDNFYKSGGEKIFVEKLIFYKTHKQQRTDSPSTDTKKQQQEIQKNCFFELYNKAMKLTMERQRILAIDRPVSSGIIINTMAIKAMADRLPTTKQDMMQIDGVNETNYDRFGDVFLEIIRKHKKKMDEICTRSPYGIGT